LSTTSPLADDWGYADGSAAALSGRSPAQFFRSPYVDAAPTTGGARRTAGDPTSASVTTAAAAATIATTATTSNPNAGMGNYDRDYHLRMQMQPVPRTGITVSPHPHHHHSANSSFPQQPPPQYAAQTQGYRSYAPQDHSRLKAGGATSPLATPSGMGSSYFHQLLETDRRGGNNAQPSLYTSSAMAGGYVPSSGYTGVDTAKRGRGNSNTGGNNSSSSGSNSSFLPTLDALPFTGPGNGNSSTSGYASPPGGSAFDADHPLPDFSTDWFVGRISPPHTSSSAMTSTSIPLPHPSPTGLFGGVSSLNTSHGHPSGSTVNVSGSMDDSSTSGGATSSGNGRLGGLSGLPSPSGIFNVDALLPDYEASLYSLWNNSSNGPIGYDQDNEQQHSHAPSQPHSQPQIQSQPPPQAQRPTSPHMYISAEDELKMDYPTLSEFNQGELDYLYDPMETGGPSPTTPLGTTPGSSVNKGDHYAGAHRGSVGNSREPHVERLVGSSDYLAKREQSTGSEDSSRASKKPRSAFGGSFSGESGNARLGGNSVASGGGFRSLARNATIEAKRPLSTAAISATYHSGNTTSVGMTTGLSHQTSQHLTSGTAKTSATAAGTTPTSSGEGGGSGSTSKRPRSRQCDFPGCTNRARSHQKCKKHGGAHQCVFDGCTKNSQSRGLCIAHGGGSRCKVEGCVRAAQSKGLCKSHGGGEFCAVEGCRKKAHLKHLCRTHGGGVRCKFAKCSKWAQRKGWCMAHAKEFLGS
jgi:hypothetical protein